MRPGPLALGAVLVLGVGYAFSRLPLTRRFVATVRTEAAGREAELREGVEVAVRTDATTRAPRHAADPRIPDLDVEADRDRGTPGDAAAALTEADPGRSLTPDQAHDLLLDPAGLPRADRRAR